MIDIAKARSEADWYLEYPYEIDTRLKKFAMMMRAACNYIDALAATASSLKAEVEILHQNTDTLKTMQQTEREGLMAENARFRKALSDWLKAYDDTGDDNGPSLVEHDCALAARAALAAPQTGGDDV